MVTHNLLAVINRPRSTWGPTLDEYSRYFDPRESEFSEEEDVFKEQHGIPTLARLETMLCHFDSCGDTCASIPERTIWTIDTLSRYLSITKFDVFTHYYGFLCIRRLFHLMCIVLLNDDDRDKLFKSLDKSLDLHTRSRLIAYHTTEFFSDPHRLEGTIGPGQETSHLLACSPHRGPDRNSLSFLIHALWRDRKSFMTLCQSGQLPGCFHFFLIASVALQHKLDEASQGKTTTFISDLFFRLYLVGSNRDRQILDGISREVFVNSQPSSFTTLEFVDTQDKQTILKCYSDLLFAFQHRIVGFNVQTSMMTLWLTRYVVDGVARHSPKNVEEYLEAIRLAVEYLWLVFGHPELLNDQDAVWRTTLVTGFVCSHLQVFTINPLRKSANILRLCANALVSSNIVGFLGRVGLLRLDFAVKSYRPDISSSFSKSLETIANVLKECVSAAPLLLVDTRNDWQNVFDQMDFRLGLCQVPVHEKREHANMVFNMIESWAGIGKAFSKLPRTTSQICAYPRCFSHSHSQAQHAKYTCAKCYKATYCSLWCQAAHWKLANADSHKLECRLFIA